MDFADDERDCSMCSDCADCGHSRCRHDDYDGCGAAACDCPSFLEEER